MLGLLHGHLSGMLFLLSLLDGLKALMLLLGLFFSFLLSKEGLVILFVHGLFNFKILCCFFKSHFLFKLFKLFLLLDNGVFKRLLGSISLPLEQSQGFFLLFGLGRGLLGILEGEHGLFVQKSVTYLQLPHRCLKLNSVLSGLLDQNLIVLDFQPGCLNLRLGLSGLLFPFCGELSQLQLMLLLLESSFVSKYFLSSFHFVNLFLSHELSLYLSNIGKFFLLFLFFFPILLEFGELLLLLEHFLGFTFFEVLLSQEDLVLVLQLSLCHHLGMMLQLHFQGLCDGFLGPSVLSGCSLFFFL